MFTVFSISLLAAPTVRCIVNLGASLISYLVAAVSSLFDFTAYHFSSLLSANSHFRFSLAFSYPLSLLHRASIILASHNQMRLLLARNTEPKCIIEDAGHGWAN